MRWKWAAYAYFVALLAQGMPLDGEFAESQEMFAEESHAMVAERVTTTGLESAVIPALIWGALYLVAFLSVLRFGKRSFLWTLRRQWPLALLLLLVPLSAFRTSNVLPVVTYAGHTFGAVLLAFGVAMHYRDHPLGWLRRLALTLGIALTIHLIAVFTVPTFAIAYDDRWRGLATHSNAFGALAFLSLWANCASLLLEKKDPWPRALFIAAAVLALYGAQSATSTISALASFVALLLLIAPKAKRLWRSMLRAIILAVPVVVLCIYALFDVLLEILGPMIGRSADMTGRLALWATAIDLVSLKPILGWGFDNNAAVILETGLPTVHFHNGVLDLAVRGGVVSVTLLAAVLIGAYRHVNRAGYMLAAVIVPFVLGFMLHNLAEVSFMAPRNAAWLLFLAMIFMSILHRPALPRSIKRRAMPTRGALRNSSSDLEGRGSEN